MQQRKPIARRSPNGPRTPHVQFRAKTPASTFMCRRCGQHRASTWHHWLPVRKLREHVRSLRLPHDEARVLLSALIHDERNLSPYALTCHLAAENHAPPFTRAEVPASAFEFADELGLVWLIERLYR